MSKKETYGMNISSTIVIDGDDIEMGLKFDDTEGGKVDFTKKGNVSNADAFLKQVEREAMRQYYASALVNANNIETGKTQESDRIKELEAEVASLKKQLEQKEDAPKPQSQSQPKTESARKPTSHLTLGIPEFDSFLDELFHF